ncbi:hypothetical protein CHARACLAT_006105 [Characodon lateralis]|uniref:Uncharacterized protein n=1 Tax=Characodon lateralis TaxID=208331 RepID=A0ABU7DGR8_9TELE|nr:hypothetical protein [Characodon lateralis]
MFWLEKTPRSASQQGNEATSNLALCLAVAPSWRGTSAELLLPTTYCSPYTDGYTWPCLSVFNPVSPRHSYWLRFYCD